MDLYGITKCKDNHRLIYLLPLLLKTECETLTLYFSALNECEGHMGDLDLPKDAKYKSFIAQVDKSLKSFEYSTEWADLISALGRLIKVSIFCSRSFV